jgi:hypothetical protein
MHKFQYKFGELTSDSILKFHHLDRLFYYFSFYIILIQIHPLYLLANQVKAYSLMFANLVGLFLDVCSEGLDPEDLVVQFQHFDFKPFYQRDFADKRIFLCFFHYIALLLL